MTPWFLLWAALLNSGDVTVCAQVGPLRVVRGVSLALGRNLSPPLWSVYRRVNFQVCAPDGRPRPGRVELEVSIEPLTPEVTPEGVVSRSVSTDEQGRFTGTYGAANREPGPAWPEGVRSVELHRFLLKGKTIATFALEREAGEVRFYRR